MIRIAPCLAVAVTVSMGLMFTSTAHAIDPKVRCSSSKIKETAKFASCILKAVSKGLKKGLTTDRTKCDLKFEEKWDRVEQKDGADCPTLGDFVAMTNLVDEFAGDVPRELRPPKTVFATSEIFNGNLGGSDGADAKCQAAADAAGLSGTYRAWLFGLGIIPLDPGDYPANEGGFPITFSRYVRVDGQVVADYVWDFVDPNIPLINPINLDENGALVTKAAWTAIFDDGTENGLFNCNNFLSDDGLQTGHVGDPQETDFRWTFTQNVSCGSEQSLYCFEQ